MMQDFPWLFDEPIAEIVLASTFVLVALQYRQLRLMQHRTNVLAAEVYELKVLVRTMSYVPEAASLKLAETEPALPA